MTTRRFTLSNIALYILLFGIIFYIQHMVIIDLDEPFRYFDLTETIVLFFILLIVGSWYFLYEYKQRGLKLNFPLAVILLAFFIISLIITLNYPETSEHIIPYHNDINDMMPITVTVTMDNKILFLFINFFALLFIYIFLAVLPLKVHCTKQLNLIFYCTVILALIACIYSFATETEIYTKYFESHYSATQSFTNNPNNYAMILMFGCIAALFLHHTTHGFWWFIFAFFFYLMIFPSDCRTNIGSCGVILVGYCLIRLILSYKKHPYMNSVILFAVLFVVATFALSYFFYIKYEKTFNSKILAKVDEMIDYITSAKNDSRIILWARVKVLLNQGFWVTGVGFGLFSGIYAQYYNYGYGAGSDSPHNGYYQTMGCGGWILLSFLTITLLYLLWMMIRIFRRHKTLVLYTTFILIGFGFHLTTEAATPLIPSSPLADCLMMSIFTFVPVYSTYYHECHTKINREIVQEANESREKTISFKKEFGVGQAVSFFGVLAACVVSSLLPIFAFGTIWIIIAGSLLGLALLLPIGIEALIQKKQFNIVKYLLNVLVPYLGVAVIYLFLTVGIEVLFNFSYLIQVSLSVGLFMIYIGAFITIPYLNNRVGAVLPFVDVLTRTYERHLAKKLPTSEKPDRYTLYEKATRVITPKPFRNEL